jgi:hypothetical protein
MTYFKGLKKKQIFNFHRVYANRVHKNYLDFIAEADDISSGISSIFQTHKRYTSNLSFLNNLCNTLKSLNIDVELLHESSIIGLPYKIKYIYKTVYVEFDGLIGFVEKRVNSKKYSFNKFKEFVEYNDLNEATEFLIKALDKINPKYQHYLKSSFDYYFIEKADYSKLPIKDNKKLNPEVNLAIPFNDDRVVRITSGVGETSTGKITYFFLGNENKIDEGLAYDLHASRLIQYFESKLFGITKTQKNLEQNIRTGYKNLVNNIWNVPAKFQAWKTNKKDFSELLEIKDFLTKLDIFASILRTCAERNLAFYSIPVTLWINDEKPDSQEKTSWTSAQPFILKIDGDKFEASNENRFNPFYLHNTEQNILGIFAQEIIIYTLTVAILTLLFPYLISLVKFILNYFIA